MNVEGCALEFATETNGCLILQRLIKCSDVATVAPILKELFSCEENMWRCLESPHGNFVLQAVIAERPAMAEPILDVVVKSSANLIRASTNLYGCRVVQRLIDQFPSSGLQSLLVASARELLMDRYGAYVLECCVKTESIALAKFLTEQASEDVFQNTNSGCVIANLFEKVEGEVWSALAHRVTRNPETVLCLAKGRRGHQAIAALLRSGGPFRATLQAILQPEYDGLKQSRYGRTINKLARDSGDAEYVQ